MKSVKRNFFRFHRKCIFSLLLFADLVTEKNASYKKIELKWIWIIDHFMKGMFWKTKLVSEKKCFESFWNQQISKIEKSDFFRTLITFNEVLKCLYYSNVCSKHYKQLFIHPSYLRDLREPCFLTPFFTVEHSTWNHFYPPHPPLKISNWVR